MTGDEERRFERRFDSVGGDIAALRGLAAELDDLGEAWARTWRLRLARKIVGLQADRDRYAKLGDFWSRYGLAPCDGRPLYAYRLDDEGFARLAEDVRAAAKARRLDTGATPALFVLWASEWFRRCYRGDGQRWEALASAIEISSDQTFLRALAEKGLTLWGREVRRLSGGDRRILSTLACEGGFPAAAVEEGGRGWAREVLRVIVGPLLAEPSVDLDHALDLARSQSERLPQSFRDEHFFALCADLAAAVVRLRREAEAPAALQGIPAAAWLTINRPTWRDDLPISSRR